MGAILPGGRDIRGGCRKFRAVLIGSSSRDVANASAKSGGRGGGVKNVHILAGCGKVTGCVTDWRGFWTEGPGGSGLRDALNRPEMFGARGPAPLQEEVEKNSGGWAAH